MKNLKRLKVLKALKVLNFQGVGNRGFNAAENRLPAMRRCRWPTGRFCG